MRRTLAAVTLAASTVLCARAATGQQRGDAQVVTRVGIQQLPLAGVIGDAPLVFSKGTGGDERAGEKGDGKGEGEGDGKGDGKGEGDGKGDRKARIVRATSRPVVRSNTAWRLRVTLLPPLDPALLVKIVAKDGREITLSARETNAVVAEGARACDRCEVLLAWEFVYAAGQKGKKAPLRIVPGIHYTAEPRH